MKSFLGNLAFGAIIFVVLLFLLTRACNFWLDKNLANYSGKYRSSGFEVLKTNVISNDCIIHEHGGLKLGAEYLTYRDMTNGMNVVCIRMSEWHTPSENISTELVSNIQTIDFGVFFTALAFSPPIAAMNFCKGLSPDFNSNAIIQIWGEISAESTDCYLGKNVYSVYGRFKGVGIGDSKNPTKSFLIIRSCNEKYMGGRVFLIKRRGKGLVMGLILSEDFNLLKKKDLSQFVLL
ncbi:MAG: hypothetical protein J0L75_19965 [Spirochaetes bacterium]|nr:hypothetical protein [Spirochaetota bacterium]